jgi:hypothetical protein
MDYSITPSIDGTFIILKIRGNINREIATRLNLETHALGRQLNVRRYLVDVTEARNTDTVIGNYNFAYSDMQKMEGIDKRARVATLVSPGDHSHDFTEMVSRNAGLNVRIFTDLYKAKQFLMHNDSPGQTARDDS